MFSSITRLLQNNNITAKHIISILIGLGIASIFRKVCKNDDCYEFKGADNEEIKKNIYEYNNKCYQFIAKNLKCNSNKKQVRFA